MAGKQILTWALVLLSYTAFCQSAIEVASPSGKVKVTVMVADSLYYSVAFENGEIIQKSSIAMLTDKFNAGIKAPTPKISRRSMKENIVNLVPFKRKNIPDHFNEVTLGFKSYSVIFRAYDDGVAYRFTTNEKGGLTVLNEVATFNFANPDTAYISLVNKRENLDIFHTSFEEPYTKSALAGLKTSQVGFSPALVKGKVNAVITESDLLDYPGMFLKGTGTNSLKGLYAPYPKTEEVQGGEFKQHVVVSRENYIAKTSGTRSFPWRVIALAKTDADLLMSDLVYRLATPAKTQDWSWIKPGISTEEWILGSNIYGVDFESGLNTATYKYYIDFASRFGMQYVMLDAGWSDPNDLFKITEGMDLEAVAAHAKSKNISLIFWTLAMTLDRQLDEAMKMFNRLGVKCIMTDFMDRDDQKMLQFYERIAKSSAEHKVMVMFHGAFKNAGLERTYPHLITREGVLGSEYNIWSEKATPEHDLLIPFIRMIAGPMDYEPGFMVNANQKTFRPLADHVMSQGTRCHQLAMFVVYESPLQMFSGSPSDAYKEVDYTTFLASLPTTWDETVVLDAKLGDYVVVARRKDQDWYLAAMTDWSARTLEVDLTFLGKGDFRAFSVKDGVNAAQHASDYRMGYDLVNAAKKLKIEMAPGGGFVVKLIKLNDARP
ncbi:MAG TPA: glycoside hydrolase family 97 protein [Chryseosolibacter sp.]